MRTLSVQFGRPTRATERGEGPRILAWDGRLDNCDDLRLQLNMKPAEVALSDESLLLACYRKWGVSGLRNAIGDWSAVIRDDAQGEIVMASDFAGVRPLYYCVKPDGVMNDWLGPTTAGAAILRAKPGQTFWFWVSVKTDLGWTDANSSIAIQVPSPRYAAPS